MKKFLMLFLFLILCGCNNELTNEEKIEKIMEEEEYIIVDVRSENEYKSGHIVGAINIPHNEISENSNLDKDKVIFVYCMSGTRSEMAYNTLNSLGYEVYDLGAFSEINLPKE